MTNSMLLSLTSSMLVILCVSAQTPHFPTYCNYKGYCHCPPLPLTCKSNVDCVTPWYNSYCQAKPNATGVCHSELPPKCVKDTDCARKPNASDTTVFDAVSTKTALPSTPSAVAAGNFTQYYCNGTKPLDDCTNDLGKCRASTHVQGSCLQTNHGKSSATATCPGLGSIKYNIYVGSHNCTGPVVVSTQILDVCEEGGGGKYFVKLECS